MTATINASTTAGVVTTADTSGILQLQTNGTAALTVDASQNVGIGTSSPSSKLHVVSSSGENKIISEATAASQQASLSLIVQAATPGQTVIYMGKTGATTNGQLGYDPNTNAMTMYTNNAERMRIDSSGNVLVTNAAGLGYGTGAGGTVTQAPSKGTGVTLNKPTGQVTTNNAALASGATVSFSINNSIISATDVIVVVVSAGSSYTVQPQFVSGGVANIRLTNTTGGSLSEAVVINFAVIKGATS